jgi:hypothetical protein
VRIGAVTADAIRVEYTDAEREIVDALIRPHIQANIHALAGLKQMRRLAACANHFDAGDLHFARTPSPFRRLKHVRRLALGIRDSGFGIRLGFRM